MRKQIQPTTEAQSFESLLDQIQPKVFARPLRLGDVDVSSAIETKASEIHKILFDRRAIPSLKVMLSHAGRDETTLMALGWLAAENNIPPLFDLPTGRYAIYPSHNRPSEHQANLIKAKEPENFPVDWAMPPDPSKEQARKTELARSYSDAIAYGMHLRRNAQYYTDVNHLPEDRRSIALRAGEIMKVIEKFTPPVEFAELAALGGKRADGRGYERLVLAAAAIGLLESNNDILLVYDNSIKVKLKLGARKEDDPEVNVKTYAGFLMKQLEGHAEGMSITTLLLQNNIDLMTSIARETGGAADTDMTNLFTGNRQFVLTAMALGYLAGQGKIKLRNDESATMVATVKKPT